MKIFNSHDDGATWTDIKAYQVRYDCPTIASAKAFLLQMHRMTDGTVPSIKKKDGIYSVVSPDKLHGRFKIE